MWYPLQHSFSRYMDWSRIKEEDTRAREKRAAAAGVACRWLVTRNRPSHLRLFRQGQQPIFHPRIEPTIPRPAERRRWRSGTFVRHRQSGLNQGPYLVHRRRIILVIISISWYTIKQPLIRKYRKVEVVTKRVFLKSPFLSAHLNPMMWNEIPSWGRVSSRKI